jgi:PAS domain S-box-containing protein
MPKFELQALLRISQINLTKSLPRILEEILIIIAEEIGAHSGSMMRINEETGELEMVAAVGLTDEYIERNDSKGIQMTKSPSEVVLETGGCYLGANILEAHREPRLMDCAREFGFAAQIGMPLKRRDEVIGLLNLYMAEPHEFTEDELAFLSIAASQAAAVIEHARLSARISPEKVESESKITEQKRAVEMLWERKEIFRNILSASPVGIGLVVDRTLSWTNERMMELFGFNPDEEYYVGQSAEVLYASKEEHERVGQLLYKDLKAGKIAEVDAKLKRRDGSIFDGHIKMSFLDPAHPRKGAVATISDISWRKNAEENLKNSEERLKILFEYAPDAYFLTDLNGTFIDGNRAAEEISGYTREEVIGKNFFELIKLVSPREVTKAEKLLTKSAQGEPAGPIEFTGFRKDGKKVVAEVRTVPIKIKDQTMLLCIARDITERRQVEEALVTKNRELEREINERKQIEKALRVSERKYKEIAEFLPDQLYGSILILS